MIFLQDKTAGVPYAEKRPKKRVKHSLLTTITKPMKYAVSSVATATIDLWDDIVTVLYLDV